MTIQPQTIAVLGANGDAGRAISRVLDDRGHTVIDVTRSPRSASQTPANRTADLEQRDQTIAACQGAEVIINAAQPGYSGWATKLPVMIDNAIAAARANDARLIMVDNLYMYSPASGPISESSPESATDPKGRIRAEMGHRILDAHNSGEIRASIARQSDFYGPRARNSALWMTGISRGLAGKSMMALFDADQPHSFAYLPDTARAIAHLVEAPNSDGQVWILPSAPPLTQAELLELVNQNLEQPVKVRTLGSAMVGLGGLFDRELRESRSVKPQFDRPWVTDWSRFDTRFGPFTPTPHATAVETTVTAETGTDPATPA